jgi:hypothetical protein
VVRGVKATSANFLKWGADLLHCAVVACKYKIGMFHSCILFIYIRRTLLAVVACKCKIEMIHHSFMYVWGTLLATVACKCEIEMIHNSLVYSTMYVRVVLLAGVARNAKLKRFIIHSFIHVCMRWLEARFLWL